MTRQSNGVTLWKGPDIAVILTGLTRPSSNRKTGDMLQTWIIRTDMLPTEAVKSGADAAICGACPLRGILGKERACYVNVGQAPQQIYRAYHRGSYPLVHWGEAQLLVKGRAIRFGAYGDPAMVPLELWEDLAEHASTWTGYTHQWRNLGPEWAALFMASTDATDREEAHAAGWRTFTVTDAPRDSEDVACPAAEGLTTCAECSLCKGTASGAKSVSIRPHGSGAKYAKKTELVSSV